MSAGMLQFSESARKVLSIAHQEAVGLNHPLITSGHILLGLVQDEGTVGLILAQHNTQLDSLRVVVDEQTPITGRRAKPGKVDLHNSTQTMLELAIGEVYQAEQSAIAPNHLLLALLSLEDATTQAVLRRVGLVIDDVRASLNAIVTAHHETVELDSLLDTLRICRRMFTTEKDPVHLSRLDRIEVILRDYLDPRRLEDKS